MPLCDAQALMASEPSLALDLAVVGQPLAADVQAIETYIGAHHAGVSWHLILNNHASKRPKIYGGSLAHAVTKCKKFEKIEACSTASFWRCILQLPNSFQPNDGRRLEAIGEGCSKDDASEDACRKAMAKLLYEDPSNVVLRPKHWKLSPDELIASLPVSRGSHQALPVHISARQKNAGAQAALLSESERADLIADLIRLCLNTHGGEFDPSKICHQKTLLGPDEERVYSRLNRLLLPGELRDFIDLHPEFTWRAVNPKGMLITWASVLPDSVGQPAPSSASAAPLAPTNVVAVPQYVEKPMCLVDNISYRTGSQSVFTDMKHHMLSLPKRGGSPSSASGLAHSAVSVSSLVCKHGAHDHDEKPWPQHDTKGSDITVENHIDPSTLEEIWPVMDNTVFRDDKRGWGESWKYLLEHRVDFEYVFMNTSGGYRGLELICVHCRRSCTLKWNKHTSAGAADTIRKKWLSFLCQQVLPSSASKPIV